MYREINKSLHARPKRITPLRFQSIHFVIKRLTRAEFLRRAKRTARRNFERGDRKPSMYNQQENVKQNDGILRCM